MPKWAQTMFALWYDRPGYTRHGGGLMCIMHFGIPRKPIKACVIRTRIHEFSSCDVLSRVTENFVGGSNATSRGGGGRYIYAENACLENYIGRYPNDLRLTLTVRRLIFFGIGSAVIFVRAKHGLIFNFNFFWIISSFIWWSHTLPIEIIINFTLDFCIPIFFFRKMFTYLILWDILVFKHLLL